ncbi:hypothetical protein [Citricoccus alkalitolerans]|uniref:Uncharacterized protein n=1 Tax=Citricoccus alkalitolerans TaxID=246603 RepID=A0ABV8XUP8_9MICC
MRWRKSVFADTLEELEHEAELHFRPGTTYSIFSIREEGGAEDRVSYRADAHPPQEPGQHRTRSRGSSSPKDGRTRVGRNVGHDGGPEAPQDAGQMPGGSAARPSIGGDGAAPGSISGRLAALGAGPRGVSAGDRVSDARSAPPRGPDAGQPGLERTRSGSVGAVNPDTVQEIPGWGPGRIPTTALQGGPGLNTAYGLLMDGVAAGANPSTEPDTGASTGASTDPSTDPSTPTSIGAGAGSGHRPAAVVPVFSTEDPHLHEMLDHAAAPPDLPDTLHGLPHADPPGSSSTPRRFRLVFAGLLDDAVEAAERTGHHTWSAAGVLNGGRAGAPVVCYGLGDGSDAAHLAEGLLRYAPMHLVLAIDSSRKHADTQVWVRQVAKVTEPASVVAVPRTVTGTPGTVRDLGYRLYTPSEFAEFAEHPHR